MILPAFLNLLTSPISAITLAVNFLPHPGISLITSYSGNSLASLSISVIIVLDVLIVIINASAQLLEDSCEYWLLGRGGIVFWASV